MRSAMFAAVVAMVALPALADRSFHPIRDSVPAAGIRRVIVDVPAGAVRVRNGDAKTITISGEVESPSDDVTAVIRIDGDQATVERRYGPNGGSWASRTFRTQFTIRLDVPRGTSIEFTTHYGELHLDGDFGDLFASLRAGEIHLTTPRAAVRDLHASVRVGEVHADFGDERVNNEGVFPGSTDFHNDSGHSRIDLHATAGEVHVTLTR